MEAKIRRTEGEVLDDEGCLRLLDRMRMSGHCQKLYRFSLDSFALRLRFGSTSS